MNYRDVVNPQFKDISPLPVPDSLSQLYTGEQFSSNAPWRSFPVLPDAAYMTHINLRSANPPPGAIYQMTIPDRGGNNSSLSNIPGVQSFLGDSNFGPFNFRCIPCIKKTSCTCDYDCPCKAEICANIKTQECPCKTHGCPITYIPIN
jgi:hypothetical protein